MSSEKVRFINAQQGSLEGQVEDDASPDTDSPDMNSHEPSSVAQALNKLRSSAFRAAATRETLPHPMFWSLFLGQVSDVRKKKDRQRLLASLLSE